MRPKELIKLQNDNYYEIMITCLKVAYGTISNYQLSDTFKLISDAYSAREDDVYNDQI